MKEKYVIELWYANKCVGPAVNMPFGSFVKIEDVTANEN